MKDTGFLFEKNSYQNEFEPENHDFTTIQWVELQFF